MTQGHLAAHTDFICHVCCCAGPPTPAEIRYEAESPDEAALVVAAKVFGFFMIKRTNTTITLRERMPDGSRDCEYDVLNLLEFNSTRKRMSVIVKDRQTGRMVLYCKVSLGCAVSTCGWGCSVNSKQQQPTPLRPANDASGFSPGVQLYLSLSECALCMFCLAGC